MTEQTTTAQPDATVTAALPAVPHPDSCDDGYDWMDQLTSPWIAMPHTAGRVLGSWPLVCVAFYTDRTQGHYGIAAYWEGSVEVRGYASEAARNADAEQYMGMED